MPANVRAAMELGLGGHGRQSEVTQLGPWLLIHGVCDSLRHSHREYY